MFKKGAQTAESSGQGQQQQQQEFDEKTGQPQLQQQAPQHSTGSSIVAKAKSKYHSLTGDDDDELPPGMLLEDTNDIVRRQYFGNEVLDMSRSKLFEAKGVECPPGVDATTLYEHAASIPPECAAFKFTATFANQSTGRYYIAWKLKALPDMFIPWGFHIQATVSYEAERADISGSLDVVVPEQTILNMHVDEWQNIIVQEQLVVRPHRGRASVIITLTNIEGSDKPDGMNNSAQVQEYQHFMVGSVEIRPCATPYSRKDLLVYTPGRPCASLKVGSSKASLFPNNIPISRIASATELDYIAVLRVYNDTMHLGIWDVTGVVDAAKGGRRFIKDKEPIAEASYAQPGLNQIPLGLTISPDGQQVAVFQEPMIGDWGDGSDIEEASFAFRLYSVPSTLPAMGGGGARAGTMVALNIDYSATELPLSSAAVEISSLKTFVGYGQFLYPREEPAGKETKEAKKQADEKKEKEEKEKAKEEKEKAKAAADGAVETVKSRGLKVEGGADVPISNLASTVISPPQETYPRLFVACNGIYLDIYNIRGANWRKLHTITLVDLSPTLSRRITCQMMMESIGPNTFLWLEAQGQSCSTWALDNGGNVNHISSDDNVSFKGRSYRSHSKMAISPHESIIALASIDGSIRTYFAATGMEISKTTFLDFKIEYLGFLGQDDQLLVILRDSATHELRSTILDSLDLLIELKANPVPIPTAGTTLLTMSANRQYNQRMLICAAEGSVLRFFKTQEAFSSSGRPGRSDHNIQDASEDLTTIFAPVDADELDSDDQDSEDVDKIAYRLQCILEKKPSAKGDGKFYWVIRMEVLQETLFESKVVFSFVPEPWLRCQTNEYTKPDLLLTTYFLPCQKRFIVIGYQSIQIWALPFFDHPEFDLLAFWSTPMDEAAVLAKRKGIPSPEVYDHYEKIESAKVSYNFESDHTLVRVKMVRDKVFKTITLPGLYLSTTRQGILPCYRSIHLLAAAYAYASVREEFESHASELVRFTIQHINRMSTLHNILNTKKPERKDQISANILFLLMRKTYFQPIANPFIKGLLTTDGYWIPREQFSLNPIQQAIDLNNREIVYAFVYYCIKNAKKYHPAYLMPAIQSLGDLVEQYPDLTAEMFQQASYIKVKNKAYIAANAIIANPQWSWKFWKDKSTSLNDYENPVFHIRSQLPFRADTLTGFLAAGATFRDTRLKTFPGIKELWEEERADLRGPFPDGALTTAMGVSQFRAPDRPPPQPLVKTSDGGKALAKQEEYMYDIFVAPFPKMSSFSKDNPKSMSGFTSIAGTELFDTPAMVATLRFKWYKFGLVKWASRFSVVLAFSVLFIIITAEQIAATGFDKYLLNWQGSIIAMIALGGLCLLYELWQFVTDWRRYISTAYNILDLVAFGLPIVGSVKFLWLREQPRDNNGPEQIWWISFALLAVYTNVLFELKVFQRLGIAVHIIINIARRILWFFVVFGFFLIAFTHSFMHLAHSGTDPCVDDAGVELTDDALTTCIAANPGTSIFPKNFGDGLFSTYFFLAGMYDPLGNDMDKLKVKFMLAIFVFFTVILLLNVLIALMNDAYSESRDQGQLAWLKQWSEVIVEAEIYLMWPRTRENRDYFPDYIYYGASQQDVEAHVKDLARKQFSDNPGGSDENSSGGGNGREGGDSTQVIQKLVQKDVKNVREELDYLMNSQQNIQSDLQSLSTSVLTLVEQIRLLTDGSATTTGTAASNTGSALPLTRTRRAGSGSSTSDNISLSSSSPLRARLPFRTSTSASNNSSTPSRPGGTPRLAQPSTLPPIESNSPGDGSSYPGSKLPWRTPGASGSAASSPPIPPVGSSSSPAPPPPPSAAPGVFAPPPPPTSLGRTSRSSSSAPMSDEAVEFSGDTSTAIVATPPLPHIDVIEPEYVEVDGVTKTAEEEAKSAAGIEEPDTKEDVLSSSESDSDLDSDQEDEKKAAKKEKKKQASEGDAQKDPALPEPNTGSLPKPAKSSPFSIPFFGSKAKQSQTETAPPSSIAVPISAVGAAVSSPASGAVVSSPASSAVVAPAPVSSGRRLPRSSGPKSTAPILVDPTADQMIDGSHMDEASPDDLRGSGPSRAHVERTGSAGEGMGGEPYRAGPIRSSTDQSTSRRRQQQQPQPRVNIPTEDEIRPQTPEFSSAPTAGGPGARHQQQPQRPDNNNNAMYQYNVRRKDAGDGRHRARSKAVGGGMAGTNYGGSSSNSSAGLDPVRKMKIQRNVTADPSYFDRTHGANNGRTSPTVYQQYQQSQPQLDSVLEQQPTLRYRSVGGPSASTSRQGISTVNSDATIQNSAKYSSGTGRDDGLEFDQSQDWSRS